MLDLTTSRIPDITSTAKGAVDVIVSCTHPLSEKEWDVVDELVNALNGGKAEPVAPAQDEVMDRQPSSGQSREIILCENIHLGTRGCSLMRWGSRIAGLLPPPLSHASSPLLRSDGYDLHLARLAQLSLHGNVYLKV